MKMCVQGRKKFCILASCNLSADYTKYLEKFYALVHHQSLAKTTITCTKSVLINIHSQTDTRDVVASDVGVCRYGLPQKPREKQVKRRPKKGVLDLAYWPDACKLKEMAQTKRAVSAGRSATSAAASYPPFALHLLLTMSESEAMENSDGSG